MAERLTCWVSVNKSGIPQWIVSPTRRDTEGGVRFRGHTRHRMVELLEDDVVLSVNERRALRRLLDAIQWWIEEGLLDDDEPRILGAFQRLPASVLTACGLEVKRG